MSIKPQFEMDWVLACDIDDTLVPISSRSQKEQASGLSSLGSLCATVEEVRDYMDREADVYFGTVTGRTLASHQEYEAQVPTFGAATDIMDFKVTAVGTESYIRGSDGFIPIAKWPQPGTWQRDAVFEALVDVPGLTPQPDDAQRQYKVSFNVNGEGDSNHAAVVTKIANYLARSGVAADVVFSGGVYLDILPTGVNKGTGLLHTIDTIKTLAKTPERSTFIIAAGDSMNDKDLLRVADLAIIPGNAHDSLKQWAQQAIQPQKLYIAEQPFASGIIEGIDRHLKQ